MFEIRQLRHSYVRVVSYINDTHWYSIPFYDDQTNNDHAAAEAPKRELVSWRSLKRVGQ